MKIGVIGAGLSGLVAARASALAGASVVVFEAAARVGGQLHTEHAQGFAIEHGAEGFVAGSEALPALARSLGIAHRLIDQSVNRSYGFDGSALLPLAPGEAARFLGFQVKGDELGRGVRSFLGGMSELSAALEGALGEGASLRLRTSVQALARADGQLNLTLGEGKTELFDAVIVASNAAHASALLTPAFGAAARALSESRTLSSLSVSLGFAPGTISLPEDASGFVVALSAQRDGLRAASFSSNKFRARAPQDHSLVRVFFRPEERDLRELLDQAWVERALKGLQRIVSMQGAPIGTWVSRWSDALPVSNEAHAARVHALEAALDGSAIRLAGSAFHGSGIDAAVRSAEQAALATTSGLS